MHPKALFRTELCDAIAGNDGRVTLTARQLLCHSGSGSASNRCENHRARCPRRRMSYDMTGEAARQVYEKAGIGPEDVDGSSYMIGPIELITYEGLGLCGEGQAQKFIADGDNTYAQFAAIVKDFGRDRWRNAMS